MLLDAIFAVGNVVLMMNTATLLIDGSTYIHRGISFSNGTALATFTFAYMSMELPLAAVTCGTSVLFWALIFTYRGKVSGAHEDSDSESDTTGENGSG